MESPRVQGLLIPEAQEEYEVFEQHEDKVNAQPNIVPVANDRSPPPAQTAESESESESSSSTSSSDSDQERNGRPMLTRL